ncbi:unnamed protein product [Rhizoctonia solani]|uniref:Uncharacterized protein n=1 Tax=Rhizoctonia solani TaxID=456999 RepID=A0A8H3GXW2_9AGAM|nr:unnamed protein product [Rhizoctonia solani]CAE6519190.1 unnamed protein product [Rhizoctonia solani]
MDLAIGFHHPHPLSSQHRTPVLAVKMLPSSSCHILLSNQKILTMMHGDPDSPIYAMGLTQSRPGEQRWVIEQQSDNMALLYSPMYKKYAGVTTALHPNVSVVVTDSSSASKFVMEKVNDNSYKIYVYHGANKLYFYLSPDWNHSPKTALVAEDESTDAVWQIQPLT